MPKEIASIRGISPLAIRNKFMILKYSLLAFSYFLATKIISSSSKGSMKIGLDKWNIF
jgi:hypothetical protein